MVPSEVQDRRATNGADADNSVDANQLIDQSTNDTNHAENSVTHIELFAAVEESVISCRPLVDFFYHFDKSTNKYDCDLDMSDNDDDAFSDNGEKKKQKRKKIGRGKHAPCVTVTDRRVAICTLLKSVKFNKSRARRLFAGMIPLLKKILEEESYFPAETHQSDGQDSTDRRNGNDSDGDNGDEDGDSGEERNSRANDEQMNEESASQSVLYLRCCAYLVEAYLHGLIERTTHKRKSRNKYLINTTIDSENESNLQTAIPIIDEAYQVAEILHSTLFPLHRLSTADPPSKTSKQSKQTLSSIFSMCETYWHGRFEDREQFVTQLIPLLLIKCLDVTAQKADVKRLYSIRDALNLLDFDDEESIASLKLHLLRTVSSPLFLQSAEGRKFISHLFQLHSSFVNDLHQAVKVQLPCVKRSILKAYAEIYFTAWKASCDSRNDSEEDDRDDIQTAIEENALQDIMHAGIHAAVPNTAKAARSLLDQFYTKKKTPVVESMLHRLYGPLLWRALSSSNARVRVQASVMLVDTFPLRDPDAGREATEVCVKKSVAALASLLEDDIPSVRVAGATAASKILSSFWVAIPSKDIQSLLNLIIAKHASDATSSNVRASAVIVMQTLLEEEKTHAVLRPLLPSLGNLIHDKTEKVRLAVVKLLLYVKKIRGMKYYHVVPARHLLVRLEDEGYQGNPTGPVSAALTDLLSNSFFPLSNGKRKAVTMTDIINRTLRLLTDNPGAALVFYRNASSKLSVASICKLIAALMKCLVMFIEEEKEHRLEKFCSDDNNTSTSLLDVVPEEDAKRLKRTNASLFKEANNVALMATIAESVSILWDSIKSELSKSQNESCNELLKEIFSGNVLTEVYDHFASKFENEEDFEDSKLGDCFRACVAILHCAGNLDEPKIEGLRTQIVKNLASLKSIPEEKRSKMNFSPSVSLLCVWGMTENVAHCLGSSIVLYFEGEGREQDVEFCQQSNESKKRKSLVKVKASGKSTQLLPQLDMDVCLGILGRILKGSFSASVSARERILRSEIAYSAIENALAKAQIAAENILKARGPKVNVDMIRKIGISLECYGRFVLHKEAMKKDIPLGMPSELHALLDWISDVIVPYLVKLTGQDSTLRDLDLSMISGTGSLCSPLPSGPPKRKMNRNSSPFDPRLSNDSFISAEASFNFYQEKSVFSSSKATAITAINSVLSTYAEWISIRFLYDSTSATKVSKWCQIFKTSDMTVKRSLLPMFLRLSLIIMKYGGNLDLFNEIIQSIKDVDLTFAEEEMLDLFTSSLASLRDDKLLSEVIESTYSIVCSIGSRVADNDKDQDIDLWHAVGPCIRSLFMSLLRDGRSSLILAQFMTENPNSGSESMYSGKSVRFHVLKKLKELSPQMPSMTKILAKLNAENDEHEDTMDAGTSGFIENENNDWTE